MFWSQGTLAAGGFVPVVARQWGEAAVLAWGYGGREKW